MTSERRSQTFIIQYLGTPDESGHRRVIEERPVRADSPEQAATKAISRLWPLLGAATSYRVVDSAGREIASGVAPGRQPKSP